MTWTATHDESERTTLGAVLLEPALWPELATEVAVEDFYSPAHRALWEAFGALDAKKIPIDHLTVQRELERSSKTDRLEALGGAGYIAELAADCFTTVNAAYHARRVARLAERRRWALALRDLAASALDESSNDDDFFETAEAKVLALLQQRRSTGKLITAKQALRSVINAVEERFASRHAPPSGVTLGIGDFDRLSRGLHPKQLMILAARPSVGKSALMGNVIEHASRAGHPVLAFSLEMSAEELFERMIAAGGVNATHLRTGHMVQSDFVSMMRTGSELASGGSIVVDESGDITIAELRSRARRWRANEGRGEHALVCVDYLQLVHGTRGKQQKREEEVAEVSRGLKALAKELKCPVLALAQLNREVEKRGNKKPGLADLRESGQIEQDADIAAFLYREEVANPDCKPEDRGTAELIIAKGRNMQVGSVRLLFKAEHQRFVAASSRAS